MNNEWEILTKDAQSAFGKQRYSDAIKLNTSALQLSVNAFEYDFCAQNPDKAVSSVVVSYLNIIDSYIAENELLIANGFFEDIFYFLEKIGNRNFKNTQQAQALLNGVKKLYIEWALFRKKHHQPYFNNNTIWANQLPSLMSKVSISDNSIH